MMGTRRVVLCATCTRPNNASHPTTHPFKKGCFFGLTNRK